MTIHVIGRGDRGDIRSAIDASLSKSAKASHRKFAEFLHVVLDEMGELAEGTTLNIGVSGSTGGHGLSISGSISKQL